MRFIVCILFVCIAYAQVRPIIPNFDQGGMVWPLPSSIQQTNTQWTLNSATFSFKATGQSNGILQRAFTRYMTLCFPKPSAVAGAITSLSVNVAKASEADQIQYGIDESYRLTVASTGATLTASTVYGALRGLETFSQIIINNGTVYVVNQTTIMDTPRFGWRGLLIDTSRHWLPVSSIMETISAMSYSKLNVLHWHIVDGQSFTYQSDVYPLLSQYGAYRPDQTYSISTIKSVIAFANDHGVRVLPEFDMPSHATSWGFGYPFMTAPCYDRQNPYDFGDLWGDNPMDPTNPDVYTFIQNFLMEVATVFPDNWLHLGGDEVSFHCWNITRINNWMAQNGIKTYNELEAYFIQKVNNFVKANLKRNLIYWQEVFQNASPFIGTAVDIWKDANTLSAVINQTIYAVQSYGWYLNHVEYSWETFYQLEPIPPNTTVSLQKYVIGGETSMWGEIADASNLHSLIWPRACAIAERLWSPKTVTDINLAIPRLAIHRCRYVQRGIPAGPFQPGPGCYE